MDTKVLLSVVLVAISILTGGCSVLPVSSPPSEQEFARCLLDKDFVRAKFESHSGLSIEPVLDPHQVDSAIPVAYSRLARALIDGSALVSTAPAKYGKVDTRRPRPEVLSHAELRNIEWTPFMQFLDCYAGEVDPVNFQGRLLRGHMLLAMLTQYVDFLIGQSPPAQRAQYAREALQLVEAAELQLRSGSAAMIEWSSIADLPDTMLMDEAALQAVKQVESADKLYLKSSRYFSVTRRVLSSLQVAELATTVGIRNDYYWIGSVLRSIVAVPNNPTAVGEIARSAVDGLKAASTLNLYKSAFFAGAQEDLSKLELERNPSMRAMSAPDAVKEYSTKFAPRLSESLAKADRIDVRKCTETRATKSREKSAACKVSPLAFAKQELGSSVGVRLWLEWDAPMIRACDSLAAYAGLDEANCIPGWSSLKSLVPESAYQRGGVQ